MSTLSNSTWTKNTNSGLPIQQIPLSRKMEEDKDSFGVPKWQRQNMDSLESIARSQCLFNNAPLKDNYDIAEGNFNIQHYIDTNNYYDYTSAISEQLQIPNFLKHYDITGKYVKLLVGLFLKKPDNVKVKDKSPDATNERIRVKTELLEGYWQGRLQQEIEQKMLQQGFDPQRKEFKDDQDQAKFEEEKAKLTEELTPQGIEKYIKYNYRSAAESWGQATLSVLKDKFYLRENEFYEFKDTIIAGRVASHFRLTSNGFMVDRIPQMNVFYHISPQVRWWQDGDYGGQVFFDSRARIIDRYGYRMTNEQKEALYPEYIKTKTTDKGILGDFFSTTLMPFSDYRSFKNVTDVLGYEPLTGTPMGGGIPQLTDAHLSGYNSAGWGFGQADLVQVTEAYWRSQRKIGQLILLNPETNKPETHIVDETFDPKLFGIKEINDQIFEDVTEPNTCTWTWVTQIWQGVKINTNYSKLLDNKNDAAIYLDVKPCDFQFKGDYDPFLQPKLPICGTDFGKMVVDTVKPYQLLYNVLFNQSYELIQRNNGKMLLMDMNFLPTLKDWGGEGNIEKAMTMGKTLGFLPVDSRGSNIQGANFNQNTVVDLDDTEKITRLFNLAFLIEMEVEKQLGITPQVMGQMKASSTAYSDNAAIDQSSVILEPYFEQFFTYKKRKTQMILDMAQFLSVTEKEITLSWTTSDLGDAFLKTTGTDLLTADLGVYADYSQKAQDDLQMAKQMIAKNNTTNMPMSALIKALTLETLSDIEAAVEIGEENFAKQQQAQQQHEADLADKQLQAQAADKQADRDNAVLIARIKANAELEKVTLQGVANEGSFNPDVDLTDKLIAQKELAIKEQDFFSKNTISQMSETNKVLDSIRKSKLEENKMKHDKQLKESDSKSKKEIENQKLTQIKEQNQNQLELADKKHKADMALAKEELKMRQLDKEMKLLDIENAKKKSSVELGNLEKKVKIEETLGKVKVKTIKEIADAKIEEQQKLAKVKSKEIVQSTDLKMEENVQKHEHKLKENTETHKQKLLQIKIKPKIKKK